MRAFVEAMLNKQLLFWICVRNALRNSLQTITKAGRAISERGLLPNQEGTHLRETTSTAQELLFVLCMVMSHLLYVLYVGVCVLKYVLLLFAITAQKLTLTLRDKHIQSPNVWDPGDFRS